MRRSFVVLLACLALVPAPARAAAPADWVLATFTAGPSGSAYIWLGFLASGPVEGPVAFGVGYARPGDSSLNVFQQQLGGVHASTSRDLGGAHVALTDDYAGGASIEIWVAMGIAPGTSLSLLLFADGMSFDDIRFEGDRSTGSFTTTVEVGSGTKALTIVDPDGDGTGASVGTVGAGAVAYEAEPDRGVIGAFMNFIHCSACLATWSSTQASGSYISVSPTFGTATYTNDRFGGPAGPWRWTYTGAQTGLPVLESGAAYALYAPIGDAWQRFMT